MLIAGTGGFARQMLSPLQRLEMIESSVFFNDVTRNDNSFIFNQYSVLTTLNAAGEYFSKHDNRFLLATGGPANRHSVAQKLTGTGGTLHSMLDPTSSIAAFDVRIGDGATILQDVIIETGVVIGRGVLLNLRCVITHDCYIGDFSEISPGAILLGGVHVGDETFIGAGAVILPGITVGDRCIIGAGAVVNKSIGNNQKVAGVPAKIIA